MATLDQLISTLPTDSGQKGKAWERLCQWFLLNGPVYASQLRRVWLWDEWPERWGADNGIDLIAEAHDGGIWAIQAKAYAETTSITKADVDSFLSESNREQITFRLLIATTDAIGANARKVMKWQAKPAALSSEPHLTSEIATRERSPPRAWSDQASSANARSDHESMSRYWLRCTPPLTVGCHSNCSQPA